MLDLRHVWAAGFFDGEGCVRIKPQSKGRSYAPGLYAVQVDREPLEVLAELYGGNISIRRRPAGVNQRPCWAWERWGREGVRQALESMFPFLIVKRPQATVALEFLDVIRPVPGRRHLTDEEFAARAEFAGRMRDLNRRGLEVGI